MTETQSFLTDILKLVPEGAVCFIQAPSCDNPKLLKLAEPSQFNYYTQLPLTKANRQQLINLVNDEQVEQEFQRVEIRLDDKLLFEAYDGMEIGTISKMVQLPANFVQNYIHLGMCSVSNDW